MECHWPLYPVENLNPFSVEEVNKWWDDFLAGKITNRPVPDKWEKRFLALAWHIAEWSKDPSTQVGAVIVRPDRTIASVGFNGFPRGVSDHPSLYEDKETKYQRIVHAEVNAIHNCHEKPVGYTLYITHPPCIRCSTEIIQSGISKVVFWNNVPKSWEKSCKDAMALLREALVEVKPF